jgi:hypothetical protein
MGIRICVKLTQSICFENAFKKSKIQWHNQMLMEYKKWDAATFEIKVSKLFDVTDQPEIKYLTQIMMWAIDLKANLVTRNQKNQWLRRISKKLHNILISKKRSGIYSELIWTSWLDITW